MKPQRTISLLTIAVLPVLAAPVAVKAQFNYSDNGDGTCTIIGYTGAGGDLSIPTNINDLTVAGIGIYAFNYEALTSVTIPASVTNIAFGAFEDCTNLTSVIVAKGSGPCNIGGSAFAGCTSLTNVTIGNGVTSIGDNVFSFCSNLTNMTIPGSVTNIQGSFEYCSNLKRIYFLGDAPHIDMFAFFGCSANLVGFYLPGTTGWALSSLGHPPALLWNPVIQTTAGGFGVQTNQFGFNITNTVSPPFLQFYNSPGVVVEACTNLASPVWTPLQTLTLSNGSAYFSDPQWSNFPARYYGLGIP